MDEGWYLLPSRESHADYLARAKTVVDWLWKVHQSRSEEDGGIILVSHGNLMNALTTSLLSGTEPAKISQGLVTHCNTGITHLKLFSSRSSPERRLCSVQFINRVDHLRGHPDLLTGNEPFKDHWVQEFLLPPAV